MTKPKPSKKPDNHIWLFDTTLRDGAQARGIDFSVSDKIAIARALDELGIDYIEGGWPGANPTDDDFFAEFPPLQHAKSVAFGMTRRAGRSPDNDPGLVAVVNAKTDVTCLVGKTWDFHVDLLGVTLDENLKMIRESLALAKKKTREPHFDCEHFFDGFKANKDYALKCVEAALAGSAEWVILCDTNGGCMPDEIYDIVRETATTFPQARLGIHTHNDTGLAVANTLAAIEAGARQVQATINGIGERCGNANLITLIPNLMLKKNYTTNVKKAGLANLRKLSRMLDGRINRLPDAHAPYVGDSAFAHKGGLHAAAAVKDPASYEHIDPVQVGNSRQYVVSDQAGKASFIARLKQLGTAIDPDDKRLPALIAEVKELEYRGYAYDIAEASLELMVAGRLASVPEYFTIGRFRVMDERRFNARGDLVVESEATASVNVGKTAFHEAAVGNGPVNAVDTAIRKALVTAYPQLGDVALVDYKVRILSNDDGGRGTESVTRVLIECQDGEGKHWTSVGVSTNIIDASVMALTDAMRWKLYKTKATPKIGW
ncbi:MAG: citramalate synthase [Proteobacteria bacterium]|nr:citramalate synthase [Pseudomonadota bacterium]